MLPVMSRPSKESSSSSAASTSQECRVEEPPVLVSNRLLRVTLLSSEWKSPKSSLSTINRELAIQLAKHPKLEVSVYLPNFTEEDRKAASRRNVELIKAKKLVGYEPIDWLAFLPEGHLPHCVIGHGVNLGRQIQLLKRQHDCKWIQVVHAAPEELGMFTTYADAISKSEEQHQAEVQLCELADQVVAVGPKLADAYSRYLRSCQKDQHVLNLTPSIFTEFSEVKQATEDRNKFCVLVFGCGDSEDFKLKGYDIAAQAIAELKENSYQLMFFGAPCGKEDEVRDRLLNYGIPHRQLTVRRFDESRERLTTLLYQADLAILPSRTEGFGLTALEALSAGLPIIVNGNSGIGEALQKVPNGSHCVVDSDDPKVWAKKIKDVQQKDRGVRLAESKILCEKYLEKYNWEKPCGDLVDKMQNLVFGSSECRPTSTQNDKMTSFDEIRPFKRRREELSDKDHHEALLGISIGCATCKLKKPNPKNGSLDVTNSCARSQERTEMASTVTTNGHVQPEEKRIPTKEEIFCKVCNKFVDNFQLSTSEDFQILLGHLEYAKHVILKDVKVGSLLIIVECESLQVLEELWNDYTSGHLNEVVQTCLVTEDILNDFGLSELKLTTTITEDDYKACKQILQEEGFNLNTAVELEYTTEKVQIQEQKLQEKDKELQKKVEDQRYTDVSPFCILPPIPSHDVEPRTRQVAEITEQLKALKGANDNSLSVLYISGNPGSGKSQLARLAAKRFYNEVKEIQSATSFVMTLNAENSESLLSSYVSFARHCKCGEYAVTNIFRTKDLSTAEKIANLKTLISAKIELYTSWLLVVDNVTCVSRVHVHLPNVGNKQWAGGQMLITTQDTGSIPLTSSCIQHISVSEGMNPDDANSLLKQLSGVTDIEIQEEVARKLDYQPLSLASAAMYVRELQKHKGTFKFGWINYLKKLDEGQRSATETILAESNAAYPKSMTVATTLAVEKAMASDKVIYHTFTFLSLCAPQPILQDIVIDYIMQIDEEFEDEDLISKRLSRCSLLLFADEKSGVYIRVLEVVHDVINSCKKKYPENERLKAVLGAVTSFSHFIDGDLKESEHDQDPLVISKNIVPHLTTLITNTEQLFSKQGISQFPKSGKLTFKHYTHSFKSLGEICIKHCKFNTALKYLNVALHFIILSDVCSDEEVADVYNDLGIVHGELGDQEQARDCYEHALDIYLEKFGPEHVNVAASYNNLGTVHSKLGDREQAKECYARALNIYLKEFGPKHVNVAASYNNLGTLHSELGEKEQAKEYYARALDIRLTKLGPEHIDVATTYSNLGVLHRDLGEKEQAKGYYARALDIRLKKLGPQHVDVTNVQNELDRLQEKMDIVKRFPAFSRKRPGDTCPDNLRSKRTKT